MRATPTRKKRSAKRKTPTWLKWTKRVGAVTLLLTVVGFSFLGVKFAIAMKKASVAVENLPEKIAKHGKSPSRIMSADGKILYTSSEQYRLATDLKEIPKLVQNAVVAAEDKRFYKHDGVDKMSLLRALFFRGKKGGGSTLTMQLAKLLYTSTEQTLDRKIDDIALAYLIERQMTKDEILELYLNEVYFGAGAWGIKAAADVYFGKGLKSLTLSDAALLARCVRVPSKQNPFENKEIALRNRDVVLRLMHEEKMISNADYNKALKEEPKLKKKTFASTARIHRAPYAVQHVLQELEREMPGVDLHQGGYVIETSINAELQEYSEEVLRALIRKNRGRKVTWGAFVLMDRFGRIVVEVGGADYDTNQYNVISQGKRQPGSSFKPFVYAPALWKGTLDPNDSLSNERISFTDEYTGKVWSPDNTNGKYGGSMSVESAFKNSVNVPAVRVIDELGPDEVVKVAYENFGFRSKLDPVRPLALGSSAVSPLEMAEAYSVFMLRGDRARPFIIRKITLQDGSTKTFQPDIQSGVFDPGVTDHIDRYMRAVVLSGTGTRARDVAGARGKTGTTSDNKDAWFCGYTDNLVGIGWVGNQKYTPMSSSVFGGTITVEMWSKILKRAERLLDRGAILPANQQLKRKSGDGDIEQSPSDDEPVDEEPKPDEDIPDEDPPVDDATGAPKNVPPPVEDPPVAKETVRMEVCAESGEQATIYCPETVTRKFEKGKEPKKPCHVHG